MGVANCFLIGLQALSTEGNVCLTLKSNQEFMTVEHRGLKGELITIILLNGHSIKLPSKFTSTHRLVWLSSLVREVPLYSSL